MLQCCNRPPRLLTLPVRLAMIGGLSGLAAVTSALLQVPAAPWIVTAVALLCLEAATQTDLRRLQRDCGAHRSLQSALRDALPHTLMVFDSQLRIVQASLQDATTLLLPGADPAAGAAMDAVFIAPLCAAVRECARSTADGLLIKEIEAGTPDAAHWFEIRTVRQTGRLLVTARDICAEKEARQRLAHHESTLFNTDKLVALGTLVAGVAHEINNPNNAILLSAEIHEETWKSVVPILDDYARNRGDFQIRGYHYSELRDEMSDSFARLIRSSKRIKRIVEDLRTFARDDTTAAFEPVDINQVVESSVRLLHNQLKKSTDYFSVGYATALPSIPGQFQRLEEVVINLLQNACQALQDRTQSIKVSTRLDEQEKSITITVEDRGRGMDSATLGQAFDPFFTTRQGAGGIGLGLAISIGIVKDHRGRLEMSSRPGQGTTARIVLPVEPPVICENTLPKES